MLKLICANSVPVIDNSLFQEGKIYISKLDYRVLSMRFKSEVPYPFPSSIFKNIKDNSSINIVL